ncbi:MAG: hypothetical protein J6Z11_03945 [Candidatus Riflebacteria bacterium]|nr:hypothetical protein [Candidatus Riflebacteria bacterium]
MGDEITTTTVDNGTAAQVTAPESTSLPVQNAAENSGVQNAAPVQQTDIVSTDNNSEQFNNKLRDELKNYFDIEVKPVDTPQQQQVEQNSQQQETEQQTQQDQQQQQQQQQTQDEDDDSPVYRDSDGREVIPAIYIDELQREVTLEEVLDKFKGFDYYHQNAMKQMEDAKRINEANAVLQQQKAELQQKMDEFNASKNDPMFKIVQLFQGDEELKREVTKLVSRLRPGGFRSLQSQQAIQQRKSQMEAMQKEIDNLKNLELQRAQFIQQQQKNAQIAQTSGAIQNFVNQRVKELGDMGIKIDDSELKVIADSCVPLIKANGYKFETIANHFDNYFKMLASKSQQIINNYQQVKKSAPPAPPSGGAAPTITPTPIRSSQDFESTLAARLSQLINQV